MTRFLVRVLRLCLFFSPFAPLAIPQLNESIVQGDFACGSPFLKPPGCSVRLPLSYNTFQFMEMLLLRYVFELF